MNSRDAQALIRMVESNWRFDLGPARDLWRSALTRYDAEIATRAVERLSKSLKRIDLTDLCETIEAMTPAKPQLEQPSSKAVPPPEWVFVWGFARFVRQPTVDRALPQQEPFCDPTSMLTADEYEQLRSEWEHAGAAKSKVFSHVIDALPTI